MSAELRPSVPARRLLATAAVAFICFGCVPLATVNADGTISQHYFGYVKVTVPPTYAERGTVHAVEVSALGLQVRNGVGLGYFHDKRVAVPLDCRLVVLVRTQEQLDHAVFILNRMQKGEFCAAVYRDPP